MNETIELFNSLVQQAERLADQFSPEEMQEVLGFFQDISARIQRGANQPVPPTTNAPVIPPGANLLWILAGGQPEAFVQYLSNFPNAGLNAIVRNPGQLRNLITTLSREMPRGEPAVSDSIPHAPLQSSTVWGYQYNPKNQDLLVRFNNGSVYGYESVPPAIFKIFASGAIPAKTNGKNNFGKWWRGKNPSIGSSFHALIKLGGYTYHRLK